MAYLRMVRDVESYVERLGRFLNDKLLLFNPYTVSDERLLAGVEKMRWRGAYSLTQMVIVNFLDIQRSNVSGLQDKVIYSLGDSDAEISEYMSCFTCRRTAADSLTQVRSIINNQKITQPRQIYSLVGKRVFISRNIFTMTSNGGYGKAMRMHRLYKKPEVNAAIIREAAISAKIEMLERLLANPQAHIFLDGEPASPVNIATPILTLRARISAYPQAHVVHE